MQTSKAIVCRRLEYVIPGFMLGLGGALLIRWLLGGGFAPVEALETSAGVAALALALGHRFWSLPTEDDLAIVRLREEMGPLDLRSDGAVPITLKSKSERRLKP